VRGTAPQLFEAKLVIKEEEVYFIRGSKTLISLNLYAVSSTDTTTVILPTFVLIVKSKNT